MTEPWNLSELHKLKAEMLCKGVLLEKSLQHNLDKTFVHGAVFMLPTGMIVDTSIWDWERSVDPIPRDKLGPPEIKQTSQGLVITGFSLDHPTPIEIVKLPEETANVPFSGKKLGDFFSLHNEFTVFSVPIRECVFIATKKPCTFCSFDEGSIQRLQKGLYKNALEVLLEAVPNLTSVAIGGGTPNVIDMGASYYAALVEEVTNASLSCSVEMVPPKKLDDLNLLFSKGLNSLIMSLEVWDEPSRHKWCLGKSSVSREQYLKAYDYAVKELGRGKVSSVLLVGAESLESTYAGALNLIDRGVIPTLIPLRWYPKSRFSRWTPVNPSDYIKLSNLVAKALNKADLSPINQPGCTACGGCSLETDTQRVVSLMASS